MHILIAPNAFKNSLDAGTVADAIRQGLEQSNMNCTTDCFPIGDGGDGTGALLIEHFSGQTIPVEVKDPLGRRINSSFGLTTDGKTAIIEMADASGLRLLGRSKPDPMHASSYGTGELIKQALERGAREIICCIGGSATIDGGVGLLQALGFRFLDERKREITNIPESLVDLESIDFSSVNKRIPGSKIIVVCDVQNQLLGEQGAAVVFGPQKGASAAEIKNCEASLSKLRDVVLRQTVKDMALLQYGGAAGGMAAGLATLLNAELVQGIDYFLSVTGFDSALEKADLVITGEGSIDAQTLEGKGPFGVAKRAKQKNIPVIGLAGKVPLAASESLQEYFDILLSINNEPVSLHQALLNTFDNLKRTAKIIGDMLALSSSEPLEGVFQLRQ